ncbi:Putative membrane protein insertion efficiency factor [Polaromonas vacuolata]|uniref:Putative membrane protein insertion efficiency factor n=2 Tax=Polaromonas vacuolata TaxID=37448 RepID=A0A6H2HEL8_9BURK|nr:Putative membrane protein insertion efficiency factor [Polaromonas vacuolata]
MLLTDMLTKLAAKPVVIFLFNFPRTLLIILVKAYRLFLSASLGNNCRFEPSCSTYSLQALEIHGAAIGSYMTLKRLGRCHPWCDGGFDPVPLKKHKASSAAAQKSLFTRLVIPVTSTSSKKNPK